MGIRSGVFCLACQPSDVMEPTDLDRRTFLTTAGAAGAVALAGCTGGGDGNDSPDDGGNDGPDDGGDGGGDGGSATYLDEEPPYSDWFDGANGYEGTVDRRDADEVTVTVGVGDGFAFDPPAVAVSAGTAVTWEWTGRGGSHNVVHRDGDFQSEYAMEEGHTYSYTVEETGTYEYYCDPHEGSGMKGVVHVE